MAVSRRTRTAATFLAGLLVGAAGMGLQAQDRRIPGNAGLNHVGIVVERLDEAIAYYTRTFGFGEAAVLRDERGQPTLAFIQISRDTFLELSPASETRRPGVDHFGLQVQDARQAVAHLRQQGVAIDDPRVGRTVSFITSVTHPGGVRMELSQLDPGSMLGKAIAAWKP